MPEESDSHYPTKKVGPTDAVVAVWMVLQQNYPNAFKKVDQLDPAGVWRSNIDPLTSRQLDVGLRALRLSDERYMPNAPAIRKLMLDASRTYESSDPAERDDRDEIEIIFHRLQAITWMNWTKAMVLKRDVPLDKDMAARCCAIAHKKTAEYEHAWRTESNKDKETWMIIAEAITVELMRSWNRICKVPKKKAMTKFAQLYIDE